MVALLSMPVAAYTTEPEPRHGFNDEYVFAATRSVSEMDVNPALKVTLFPLTFLLDTAFLPFALIAGAVT
jgi:uncharacterized protein YceK